MIRHALSVWNVAGRWQGQADPTLSPEGRRQAIEASGRVGPIDLIITSDLERARLTGELLAGGQSVPRLIETGLREFDVGAWSGLTRAEIEEHWPGDLADFDAGRLPAPPGGERRSDFDARVLRATVAVAATIEAHRSERTLVVTHGGVVRAMARLQGRPERHIHHLGGYEGEVKGAAVTLLRTVELLPPEPRRAGGGNRVAL